MKKGQKAFLRRTAGFNSQNWKEGSFITVKYQTPGSWASWNEERRWIDIFQQQSKSWKSDRIESRKEY